MIFTEFQRLLNSPNPIEPGAVTPFAFAAPSHEPYVPDPSLAHPLWLALRLGRPLLIQGEPGTGKTRLAHWLAGKLGAPLHAFETKSTSQARDLFYNFDSLAAFRKATKYDAHDFIRYQALGAAILDAFPRTHPAIVALISKEKSAYSHNGPCRSVVLIDEIDKAPRDFPNDLLNEIERLYFRVPELGNLGTPGASPGEDGMPSAMRPIVIMTSNEERGLPDAFTRRCLFHEIPFPSRRQPEAEGRDPVEGQLEKIVAAHFQQFRSDGPFLNSALDLFCGLRENAALEKKPSTSELINWLQGLVISGADLKRSLTEQSRLVENTLCVLIKNGEDLASARRFVRDIGRDA